MFLGCLDPRTLAMAAYGQRKGGQSRSKIVDGQHAGHLVGAHRVVPPIAGACRSRGRQMHTMSNIFPDNLLSVSWLACLRGFLISCAGHLTCVQLLLSEGADIEQRNVVSNESLFRNPICSQRLQKCTLHVQSLHLAAMHCSQLMFGFVISCGPIKTVVSGAGQRR